MFVQPRHFASLGSVTAAVTICFAPAMVPAQTPSAQNRIPGAPSGVTAFVNVTVVPMDSDRVLTHQTVLVQNGRITALGPTQKVNVPNGAIRIDATGKFLLPGLADMHAHLYSTTHLANVLKIMPYGTLPMPVESNITDTTVIGSPEDRLFLWLANGVTTVRVLDYTEDPTQDPDMDQNETMGKQALRLRARAAAGAAWSPLIYTAGQWGPRRYIGAQPAGGMQTSTGPAGSTPPLAVDSIAAFVAAYKAKGYDLIKLHDETAEVADSVMAAAKRVGIPVVGHVPEDGSVERVLSGYKSIEHPVTDYSWNTTAGLGALAAAMRRAGVYNCPTQSHYNRLHYAAWGGTPLNLKVLQDSGVKLLIGTDELPRIGGLTRELQEFVASGLTPYQALQASTVNAARFFVTSDQTGTIAVGKRADLVLLTGNPLQDVRYTAQPAGVMIGGRWLSRAEIDRRLAHMTALTFTPGEGADRLPIKSYWANTVDEFVTSAAPVFGNEFMWAGVQEVGNRYTAATLPPGMKAFREEMTMLFGEGLHNTPVSADVQRLRTSFKLQRQALIDSMGTSDQYAVGTQRVVQLVAHQLGELRGTLPAAQQATFDQAARTWIQMRQAQGYAVSIPGVSQ